MPEIRVLNDPASGTCSFTSDHVFVPVSVGIKGIRKQMGLTAAAFAEKLGVSARTVNGWEQGKRPRSDQLVKISYLANSDANPNEVSSETPAHIAIYSCFLGIMNEKQLDAARSKILQIVPEGALRDDIVLQIQSHLSLRNVAST